MNYLFSAIISETERVPIKWGEGSILEDLLKKGFKIVKRYEDRVELEPYIEDEGEARYADCEVYILRDTNSFEEYELIEYLEEDF